MLLKKKNKDNKETKIVLYYIMDKYDGTTLYIATSAREKNKYVKIVIQSKLIHDHSDHYISWCELKKISPLSVDSKNLYISNVITDQELADMDDRIKVVEAEFTPNKIANMMALVLGSNTHDSIDMSPKDFALGIINSIFVDNIDNNKQVFTEVLSKLDSELGAIFGMSSSANTKSDDDTMDDYDPKKEYDA